MAKQKQPPGDAITLHGTGAGIELRRPLKPPMHHSGPTPAITFETWTLTLPQARELQARFAEDMARAIEAAEIKEAERREREIREAEQRLVELRGVKPGA